MLPRLETARCRLRAPEIRDLSLWTELIDEIEGPPPEGTGSAERGWETFCVYVAGWTLHGHGPWAVERREDGALLGFVHLGLEWEDHEPELGWMLAGRARGRGYATEAAAAARAHGLALLGDGAFVSYVDPANRPSSRLAARLGARRDPAAEAALGEGVEVWRHLGPAEAA